MDTTIQFRTNEKIKKAAMKVFKKEGITMSCALNSFLEEVAFKGSLPVKVYPAEKVPAPVVRSWRERFAEEIKDAKRYNTVEEMWADVKNWK